MSWQFVADVGGTNIRLATIVDGKLTDIIKMLCQDHATIEDAIRFYFSQHPTRTYTQGCFGIACPVNQDTITMTNHSWSFSKKALQAALGLTQLYVINDFSAVAHSLPMLEGKQVLQIGKGTSVDDANIAVFGPGTGLGVKHLTVTDSGWKTLDGEGGHVDFAPTTETDIVIWRYLKNKLGRVSAEDVISGRGLVNIYTALNEDKKLGLSTLTPAQISTAAIENSCALCVETLSVFCRLMGSFAGNIAMNVAAHGGVYIGGGIVSRFTDFLKSSEFRSYFEAKGVVKNYIENIPTYVILEPDHGLIGAYAYMNQQLARMKNEQ